MIFSSSNASLSFSWPEILGGNGCCLSLLFMVLCRCSLRLSFALFLTVLFADILKGMFSAVVLALIPFCCRCGQSLRIFVSVVLADLRCGCFLRTFFANIRYGCSCEYSFLRLFLRLLVTVVSADILCGN